MIFDPSWHACACVCVFKDPALTAAIPQYTCRVFDLGKYFRIFQTNNAYNFKTIGVYLMLLYTRIHSNV